MKTKSGTKIGFIKVGFTMKIAVGFTLDASCQLKRFWGIPIGVRYIDFSVTQRDSFDFNFGVEIKIDYDLKSDEEKGESSEEKEKKDKYYYS